VPTLDLALLELMDAAMGLAYPPDCAGRNIRGVELVLLDADIYGIAGHYVWNQRPLTSDHRRMLHELMDDVDRVADALPNEEARQFYATFRSIATHLLDDPARRPSN
jgi:hypothetical protein